MKYLDLHLKEKLIRHTNTHQACNSIIGKTLLAVLLLVPFFYSLFCRQTFPLPIPLLGLLPGLQLRGRDNARHTVILEYFNIKE